MANQMKDGQVFNDKMLLSPAMANTQTLTGDLTLTDDNPQIQYLDANGANRNVNLPSVANTNHIFFIYNSAAAAFNLVVKSGAVTIATIAQNQSALIMSNGATWISFSGGGGTSNYSLLKCDTTNTTINGTTAETNLFTPYSVPGNTLGTNNVLKISIFGSILNFTAATTIRFKYGGAALVTLSTSTSGVTNELFMVFTLKGDGATNAQRGEGKYYEATQPILGSTGTAAIDSTIAQNLVVTAQPGSTGAWVLPRLVLIESYKNT